LQVVEWRGDQLELLVGVQRQKRLPMPQTR
jgi:hypothetical protein